MLIQKQMSFVRTEGKLAIFMLDSGQEVSFPKDDFPKNMPEGAKYVLKMLPEHESVLDQQELARTLLNQILADDTKTPKG